MPPVAETDLDWLLSLWTCPEVRRHLWDDVVVSRQTAAEVIARSLTDFATRGFGLWGIHAIAGAKPFGFAGLRLMEHPKGEAELLVGIAPTHWGAGYATEACWAVINDAFTRCGLGRVLAGLDQANAESRALIHRLGMTFVEHVGVSGRRIELYEVRRGSQEVQRA